MSALRWEYQPDDHDPATSRAARSTVRPDRAMVTAGDDDAARGIVLGVTASVLGFWMPLTATLIWLRGR